MKNLIIFTLFLSLQQVFASSEDIKHANEYISTNYLDKKISKLKLDICLTSLRTESRWIYLIDQITSPSEKDKTYKNFEECYNAFSKGHIAFDPETMLLYYCELNEGLIIDKTKIVIMNCYFYVSKSTGTIVGYTVGNINSYDTKYDY